MVMVFLVWAFFSVVSGLASDPDGVSLMQKKASFTMQSDGCNNDGGVMGYNFYNPDDSQGYPDGEYQRFTMPHGSYVADCKLACDSTLVCVAFTYVRGNNCFLYNGHGMSGWNVQRATMGKVGTPGLDVKGTWKLCPDGCHHANGMIGYDFHPSKGPWHKLNDYQTITKGDIGNGYVDFDWTDPNQKLEVPHQSTGEECRAGCDTDALGFECVTFSYHPGNNCYLIAAGSAQGWNKYGVDSGKWHTYDKCANYQAPPPTPEPTPSPTTSTTTTTHKAVPQCKWGCARSDETWQKKCKRKSLKCFTCDECVVLHRRRGKALSGYP